MERARLQEHAPGRWPAPWASEDQRSAQQGMVELKIGSRVYHRHIDDLTREDRTARIAAERETVDWLKARVEHSKRGAEASPRHGLPGVWPEHKWQDWSD